MSDEQDQEMNEYLNEFAREESGNNLQSLLKGNLLGELTNFGGALLQAGKGALKELQSAAVKIGNVGGANQGA